MSAVRVPRNMIVYVAVHHCGHSYESLKAVFYQFMLRRTYQYEDSIPITVHLC